MINKKYTCLFYLVLLLLSRMAVADNSAHDSVGTITSLSGQVNLVRAGQTLKASVNQALQAGDVLNTGRTGRVELQLSDDSLISLSPNSSFRLTQYDYDSSGSRPGTGLFDLFKGALRAVTGAITSGSSHRFEVNTPVATIGIRGTEFTTEIGDEGLDVSMLEGKGVYMRNTSGDQVELNQGRQTTHMAFHRLEGGGFRVERPIMPRLLRDEEFNGLQRRISWLDHRRADAVHAMRARFEHEGRWPRREEFDRSGRGFGREPGHEFGQRQGFGNHAMGERRGGERPFARGGMERRQSMAGGMAQHRNAPMVRRRRER